MSVDRDELAICRAAGQAVCDELDRTRQALYAKDRRIAELEKQNNRFVAIVAACDEPGEVGRTVDALAAARARIVELETEVMRLRCLLQSEET